jgi:hypothetical protein
MFIHLEVTGSIPAASTFFFLLVLQSLLFFHPLEPVICMSYKLWNVQEKKKSGTHNICVPGIMETHNILQLFFMESTRMFRNFISHN